MEDSRVEHGVRLCVRTRFNRIRAILGSQLERCHSVLGECSGSLEHRWAIMVRGCGSPVV